MDSIVLKAPAKINLSLDVLRKRPDGYHDLRTIMQTLDLHDTVKIEECAGGIRVECDNSAIPPNEGNIAYKAARLLADRYGIDRGVRIHLEKRIPAAAGLGGGSSDAAAVLKGMNRLFSLGLTGQALCSLGKCIGADVPFFIKGGTVLAEGVGDVLTRLERLAGVDIVLVKPGFDVSTAAVYGKLDLARVGERPDIDRLAEAVNGKRIRELAANMRNVLESVTLEEHSEIAAIKDRLLELGAAGSMMSGSGPAVFGIFMDRPSAVRAYEALRNGAWKCFLTFTA